jgi:hypothetical protein
MGTFVLVSILHPRTAKEQQQELAVDEELSREQDELLQPVSAAV